VSDSVEALLFDLGQVVIELDAGRIHARWAELSGVPAADIERRSRMRVAGTDAFHRHERGEISDAAFFEHLRYALEIDLTDEQLKDGWNAVFVGEMSGIRPILAHARRSLPLYALSNTNAVHQAFWSVHFADVISPFRRIYVSNELGVRKPDVAAFQAVATAIGVPPQRILFFDDLPANVAGARASGMRAVQVSAVSDIARALRDLGLGRDGGPDSGKCDVPAGSRG
jgi:putative hydrolase of the HAD superfamily